MSTALPTCGHAADIGSEIAVGCDANLPKFGPTPSRGMCNRCKLNPDRGNMQVAIAGAIHSAAGIAKAVAGQGGADDETIANRTAICTACDQAVMVAGTFQQCTICKCATWAKVRNATEKCPLGKW
jgi:hypothetical protein